MEQHMVADLRDICDRYSTEEFDVTIFQPFFIFIDQVSEKTEKEIPPSSSSVSAKKVTENFTAQHGFVGDTPMLHISYM